MLHLMILTSLDHFVLWSFLTLCDLVINRGEFWGINHGQFGHFDKDCVGKGGAQKPLAPARVFALVSGQLEGGLEVVTSAVPILGF
jgi:hypothetical protein